MNMYIVHMHVVYIYMYMYIILLYQKNYSLPHIHVHVLVCYAHVFPCTCMYTSTRSMHLTRKVLIGNAHFCVTRQMVHVYTCTLYMCCFALFVCLTLLASFFLPSHLSFKNMYSVHVYTCTHTRFGVWCHWWFHYPGLLLYTEVMVSLFIRYTMSCEIWAQPAVFVAQW